MVHCFSENINDTSVVINGEDAHHISSVLRMKIGDEIFVSDGNGRDLVCRITSLSDEEVAAEIISAREGTELAVDIVLYQSLPKADKMEMIIQKCTELGVKRIVPVESSRCVVKLDQKSGAKKLERWQKIAKSASEQSQRGVIPEISSVMSWNEAIKDSAELEKAVVCYEGKSATDTLKTLLSGAGSLKSIGIFVGPEGGYSENEISAAAGVGIEAVSLGRRILRTETAGMALIAALMLNYECD